MLNIKPKVLELWNASARLTQPLLWKRWMFVHKTPCF